MAYPLLSLGLGLGGEKSQLSVDYSLPLLYQGRRGGLWCGESKAEDVRGWRVAQSFSGFSPLVSKW